MSTQTPDPQKYPIGKFIAPEAYTQQQMLHWMNEIKALPGKLRQAVTGLGDAQLDTPYRPGGWTIRQVVHHVADSHANAMVRFKLALTEDNPTIKPYRQAEWAQLADYRLPVEPALHMLDGMHLRWVNLLENLNDDHWGRTFHHPDTGEDVPLRKTLGMYAWHGNHHLAQITGVKF
jgi:uncharacterized damage-inducible protein DinB